MAKKSTKSVFTCQACGYQTPKWMGKCLECGKWDTLVEETVRAPDRGGRIMSLPGEDAARPVAIDSVETIGEERIFTGISEFDRVLGGGVVMGSMVLIGGDPGIGKSTLMLQALYGLSRENRRVLYVSGEESVRQLSMRSRRIGTDSDCLMVVSEIDLESILAMVAELKPSVLVVDSIQTMFNSDLTSAPGSVSQVREATLRLMLMAKKTGLPVFIIGHVTKEGAIAGPRLLEHMVDTVLYFEGDRNYIYRVLRAVKNRFGSTNEIGVFEMTETGLGEIVNPSAVFLTERSDNTAGSIVTCAMEGTRPILVEMQALTSSTSFGTPRRTILGLDHNRVALLAAVMEKKLGMHLIGHDIFMNVAGGVKVDEPAADLGIVAAVASSFLDRPVHAHTVILGEVGLTGEIRGVSQIDARVAESKKMGFTRCILPQSSLEQSRTDSRMTLLGVSSVDEAMEVMF
ncbi:MAG: DNA repair protein RadA [Deltaproteobacteria bacterium]|nr:MAG: DNA repair protein RadA [Deltaproteobacteria bacterium]